MSRASQHDARKCAEARVVRRLLLRTAMKIAGCLPVLFLVAGCSNAASDPPPASTTPPPPAPEAPSAAPQPAADPGSTPAPPSTNPPPPAPATPTVETILADLPDALDFDLRTSDLLLLRSTPSR